MSEAEEQDRYPGDDDGVLEPSDSLETDDLDYDPLDTGIIPPDGYRTMGLVGLTAAEVERGGETLDIQLAQEEPDVDPAATDDRWQDGPGPRSGRLTQDTRDAQDGAELTAVDCGIDGGAAGAEEAAVHVTTQEQDEAAQLADADENESLEDAIRAAAVDESRDAHRRPRDE
ncbi:DUF5709 domain-containing protein [Actinospica robiniae]|uniref:DUF5709 domain-containing protein n=1 Tax=Actinospica robiniae TaxID=304901 RepID=UPI00040196FA|nr:DUF5709 domain-containing protein [Actinospica robiniae]